MAIVDLEKKQPIPFTKPVSDKAKQEIIERIKNEQQASSS